MSDKTQKLADQLVTQIFKDHYDGHVAKSFRHAFRRCAVPIIERFLDSLLATPQGMVSVEVLREHPTWIFVPEGDEWHYECVGCGAVLKIENEEKPTKVWLAHVAQVQSEKMGQATFQDEVKKWTISCFGDQIATDKIERNHRFIEEALELVQSLGCTRSEAHQLVDYVFAREIGDPNQECGGVLVTLAALCNANSINMEEKGHAELQRVWGKIEKIRAKQAAKPKHSPLPAAPPSNESKLREAQIEMRDACFADMKRFLQNCLRGTPPECSVKVAFEAAITTLNDCGPDGFGAALSAKETGER